MMIHNEKGTVLPLILVISFMTASLLITISSRLESQVYSYSQRQRFQITTLIEKEAIELILHQVTDPDFSLPNQQSSGHILTKNNTLINLNYFNGLTSLEISYNFSYNNYQARGKITYNKKTQTYILN